MCPATRFDYEARFINSIEAGIAISQQHALEAGQVRLWMFDFGPARRETTLLLALRHRWRGRHTKSFSTA